MALWKWSLTGTDGAAVSASALTEENTGTQATTVADGGGTIQFETSQSHLPPSSIRMVGSGTTTQVFRLPFAAAHGTVAVSFYHRAATLPPSTVELLNVRHASGQVLRVGITATGQLYVATGSGVELATSASAGWAINRWNRIEVLVANDQAAGNDVYNVRIFSGDSTGVIVGVSSFTADLGNSPIVSIDLGTPQRSSSTWEHYFDSVQMRDAATDFIGPWIQKDVTANLGGTGTLGAEVEIVPTVVNLSGSGTLGVANVEAIVTPPSTFSYWEKVRKNFGPEQPHAVDDLKPFFYQSYAQGVTLVRYPDGVFATVPVVTEELEALEGVRVYWGGKDTPITATEADELTSAGYGDYITEGVVS